MLVRMKLSLAFLTLASSHVNSSLPEKTHPTQLPSLKCFLALKQFADNVFASSISGPVTSSTTLRRVKVRETMSRWMVSACFL